MGAIIGAGGGGFDRTLYTTFNKKIDVPLANTGGAWTTLYSRNGYGFLDALTLRGSINASSTIKFKVTIDGTENIFDVDFSTAGSASNIIYGFGTIIGCDQYGSYIMSYNGVDTTSSLTCFVDKAIPYSETATTTIVIGQLKPVLYKESVLVEYSLTVDAVSLYFLAFGGEL